jgi:hypothetical protein
MLFSTTMRVNIAMEVLFASFESLSVTPIESGKMKPNFTTLDLKANDYENFWSYIEMK